MCGYDKDWEVIGRKAWEFTESADYLRTAMDAVTKRGQWTGEVTARRRDGSPFPVLASFLLVRGRDQIPTYIVAAFQDLSRAIREALQRHTGGAEGASMIGNS
jgi:PAS domain S-box-containing protein